MGDRYAGAVTRCGVLAGPLAAMILATPACSREARDVGSDQPLTAPVSASDPRIAYFHDNVAQVGQGGRYFAWYGCGGCHAEDAPGWRNLADGRWRRGGSFDQVYRAIAGPHGYGARIPVQQLWQITADVRDLPTHTPEKLRRQDLDQQGEPTADSWNGAMR